MLRLSKGKDTQFQDLLHVTLVNFLQKKKKHFMELFRKHHPNTNIAKNGQEMSILFCEETVAKRIKGGSQRVSTMLTWERSCFYVRFLAKTATPGTVASCHLSSSPSLTAKSNVSV